MPTVVLGPLVLLTACSGLFSSTETVVPTPASSAQGSASVNPSPTSRDPLASFYDQKVDWRNCGDADCASIIVPLDYSDPSGATVDLAATRVKATGDKLGTLFVNPGGPGGSAVDYAKAAPYIVSPAIREHYDIVGVDPRGVAKSDPIHCLTDKQIDAFLALDATPDNAAEEKAAVEQSAAIGQECAAHAGALYEHMGTVDAARDLDIARAAVGDSAFNYLGKSYGTMLGATYAQLFPERVGRMVLDGDLPASLDLVQISKDQADGFEASLRDFIGDCLAHDDCPFRGTVDDGVAQFRAWLKGLDAKPIPYGDRKLDEAVALYAVLSYLYFPPSDYETLRPALASAMNEQDVKPLFDLLDQRISRLPNGTYADNSSDAFYGVTCLDRPFTGTVDDVKRYAAEWAKTAPTFGPPVAWGLLACRNWPAKEDVIARTPAAGSNPILVVSTKHDPATPYQWGVQLADELDNATLLSYDGWGHTAYFQGSDCIDGAVDDYLLSGTLPAAGVLCQ